MSNHVPRLCRHRAKRLGYVTLDGKPIYLGRWPDGAKQPPPAVQAEYDRVIAQWLLSRTANPDAPPKTTDPTVTELLLSYFKYANSYYVKHGKPTDQIKRVKRCIKTARELYGTESAAKFGPLALKAVRSRWVQDGLCRRYVNALTECLRRAWKWGVSVELVPGETYTRLKSVEGLKAGRSEAKETEPVRPVATEAVEATLRELGSVVADMVRVQHLAGMRPQEVCLMRPADIRTDGVDPDGNRHEGVWVYRPWTHKTEHAGLTRVIFLGPRAQAVLAPYLDRPAEACLFSAREAVERRRADLRARRKSKPTPSENRRKANPQIVPATEYNRRSYYLAVKRAAERAGVPAWGPNKLRHARATEIRRLYGREAARTILGHVTPGVTEIYAERDLELAAKVMREIG